MNLFSVLAGVSQHGLEPQRHHWGHVIHSDGLNGLVLLGKSSPETMDFPVMWLFATKLFAKYVHLRYNNELWDRRYFPKFPSYVFRPIILLPTEHVAQIAIFFDGDFSWFGVTQFSDNPRYLLLTSRLPLPQDVRIMSNEFFDPIVFFDIQEVHV